VPDSRRRIVELRSAGIMSCVNFADTTVPKRPISVLLIAVLYIAVGTIGFAYHFTEFYAHGAFRYDGALIELTEVSAIISGVFMLLGHNWARWLAIVWIAFHVVLSVFEAFRGFFVHCLLCALIAWALFHPGASRYFRRDQDLQRQA
jgi:hypothetical protein